MFCNRAGHIKNWHGLTCQSDFPSAMAIACTAPAGIHTIDRMAINQPKTKPYLPE